MKITNPISPVSGHIKKHKYFYIIVAIILGVVLLFTLGYEVKVKIDTNYVTYDLTDEKDIQKNQKRAKKATYVTETVYDGANVPYILYEVPFISETDKNILPGADDSYFTNKDLIERIGEDEANKYLDIATNYIQLIVGNDYRTIETDVDAFIEEYKSYSPDSESTSVSTMEYAESANADGYVDVNEVASNIAEMYVDNEIALNTTFYTDKSLVYFKYYTYWVRGMVSITPTSSSHEAGEVCEPLKEMYNIDVKYGETVNYIVDISFSPNTDMSVTTVAFMTIGDEDSDSNEDNE